MKQAPDSIHIVTQTTERAEAIKQAITLRGFDEIHIFSFDQAMTQISANPPILAILDLEGSQEKTELLMAKMPPGIKSLILAEAFDESHFVNCYDQGAVDFLVKPVAEAYLVSRVIYLLQAYRQEQIIHQKNSILVEMGVLSPVSKVFTTFYLLKQLKKYADDVSKNRFEALSILIIRLDGYQAILADEQHDRLMFQVGNILKDCGRGLDEVGEYFTGKFVFILPKTGNKGAIALSKRIQARLNELVFPNFKLKVDVGTADYETCRDYEDLLLKAMENLNQGGPLVLPEPVADVHPMHPV